MYFLDSPNCGPHYNSLFRGALAEPLELFVFYLFVLSFTTGLKWHRNKVYLEGKVCLKIHLPDHVRFPPVVWPLVFTDTYNSLVGHLFKSIC